MSPVLDHPLLFFPIVAVLLFISGAAGVWLKSTQADAVDEASSSLKTLESAVLALLGLLLGFSFAMGVSRYDTRKELEVSEANAIGTTWLRIDALDEPARSAERDLLRAYVPVRMEFLGAGTDMAAMERSRMRTAELQGRMWATGVAEATTRRDALSALFLSSLNDTIDISEKRTAAYENRVPVAAWMLLLFVASSASCLVGIGMTKRSRPLLLVLPLVIGASMALILDLDSSRAGFVQVHQNSMMRVAEQVNAVAR